MVGQRPLKPFINVRIVSPQPSRDRLSRSRRVVIYMLTKDQEKWINHLSDDSRIKIIPFDPTSQEKFEKVKLIVQSKLGREMEVVHRGASSLGISGQDEIDVYVPVFEKQFDSYLVSLIELFDKPKSHYPLERARFVTYVDGKHIDVFLINKEGSGWLNSVKFENYLRTNHAVLEEYRILKESGDGLSIREYYRKKIEFYNSILSKI